MLKILTGPTASGKSEVAIRIARRLGVELISADSMQIYRGMDIGTAKPSLETRREIPHHLIDILDTWESYSAGRFVQDAKKIIRDLESRGREPLVVGGTALYIKALTDGLFEGPEADQDIRRELETIAAEKGTAYLHSMLEGVDPASARRIQRGDLRRVVRALEVYKKTGHPISYWQTEWGRGATCCAPPYCIVILSLDRKELYRRIEERVESMFQKGLVEEVKQLRANPMGIGPQAREALGYTEVIEYLEGKMTLSEAKALIKRNTRRFAKRQMTWFRGFKGAKWLEADEEPEAVAARVIEILHA